MAPYTYQYPAHKTYTAPCPHSPDRRHPHYIFYWRSTDPQPQRRWHHRPATAASPKPVHKHSSSNSEQPLQRPRRKGSREEDNATGRPHATKHITTLQPAHTATTTSHTSVAAPTNTNRYHHHTHTTPLVHSHAHPSTPDHTHTATHNNNTQHHTKTTPYTTTIHSNTHKQKLTWARFKPPHRSPWFAHHTTQTPNSTTPHKTPLRNTDYRTKTTPHYTPHKLKQPHLPKSPPLRPRKWPKSRY